MATLRGVLSVVLMEIGYWLVCVGGDKVVPETPLVFTVPFILVAVCCTTGGFVLFVYSVEKEIMGEDE